MERSRKKRRETSPHKDCFYRLPRSSLLIGAANADLKVVMHHEASIYKMLFFKRHKRFLRGNKKEPDA
ncbi:hypothetical protein DV713_01650 [Parageobacillus thermoglucosidasius]|nr:hypothetical protein DV713_01650 [Parageobacillus thermoglucosidasius]